MTAANESPSGGLRISSLGLNQRDDVGLGFVSGFFQQRPSVLLGVMAIAIPEDNLEFAGFARLKRPRTPRLNRFALKEIFPDLCPWRQLLR